MEAYCVKCKAKREIKNATATTMKNGKPATTGECSTCGTKVFKIGKAEQADTLSMFKEGCVPEAWGAAFFCFR